MNKEQFISFTNKNFNGSAKELILKQIELFYDNSNIDSYNKYDIGEDVKLSKYNYLHGILGMLDNFDWIVNNGFISNDFTNENIHNKISHSVGMWEVKEDILLKDYVKKYSGFTITYTIGRGPGSKEITELIPYHQFDSYTEELNNREDVWMYWGDQTKEVRFLPSLVANKRQIAFILNLNNPIAQELIKADVWNPTMDEETLKDFLDYRYYDKFLTERLNRNASTTDRETAIIFGLPAKLIEGVFVGRKIEEDQNALNHIKEKLPNCYICNIDGKVIVGNK